MSYEKPLRVMCPRPGCNGIVAHIISEEMMNIKRSKNVIQTYGSDWGQILTCPIKDCTIRTSIICEGGKIKLDRLKIADDTLPVTEPKDGPKEEEPAAAE
jgi:hypothetical protein